MEITVNISQKYWSDSFIESVANVESYNKLAGYVNQRETGITSTSCMIPRNRFEYHRADKSKVKVEKKQRRGYVQIAFIF